MGAESGAGHNIKFLRTHARDSEITFNAAARIEKLGVDQTTRGFWNAIGTNFLERLVTQMYFPGDPLLQYDPIYLGVPEKNRASMISKFTLDLTEPNFALGYEFDIILRGYQASIFE